MTSTVFQPPTHSPSSTYRPGVWNLGRFFARHVPISFMRLCGWFIMNAYWAVCARRRRIVIENLLPALDGNREKAIRVSRNLCVQFGRKCIDLWRFENGCSIPMTRWSGWEHIEAAQSQKRGILLVTAHLGNWELGSQLLTERGIKLIVLTQPDRADSTHLRQASRSQHGVDTIVVGQDAFAFVDVIRRLEEGAAVALLIDRPSAPTAVEVELFGRPFAASVAAAELARAAGAVILPVSIVYSRNGYQATALAPVEYDRQELGNRESRRQLTQRIIRNLQPVIEQYIEQWYHFIPVWDSDRPNQKS